MAGEDALDPGWILVSGLCSQPEIKVRRNASLRETGVVGVYRITAMRNLAIARAGSCLSAEYLGSKFKLTWECELGHRGRPFARASLSLEDARRLVESYVEHYNVRLNRTIGYITPKDMLAGHQQEIQAERDRRVTGKPKVISGGSICAITSGLPKIRLGPDCGLPHRRSG